jgi:AraC-like DNA-binding protein
MISTACKLFVQGELTSLGIKYNSIDLGEIELNGNLTASQQIKLKDSLTKYGFELMEDRRTILVEKIKAIIINMIYYTEDRVSTKYSYILSERLGLNYNYLSKVFSDSEGVTIEKYIISQKIERIKELMTYGELNMTQIADKMNYSSVAHLSLQFKKNTGFTPSGFRLLKGHKRRTVEEISGSAA